MKNVVLCFDSTTNRPGPRDATNAEALFRLLDSSAGDRQLTWYDAGEAALNSPRLLNPAARRWRRSIAAAARESVVDAYFFLAEHWQPGDRIFLLGAGRGGHCARALARMLGTVGMMTDRDDHVAEYALASFALPAGDRTAQDWKQIHRIACALEDRDDVAVPVHFLGMWDTVKVPGVQAISGDDWLGNVVSGRHAVAIDGGFGPFGECRMSRDDDAVEEVWFRGAHCDVVGGPNAYWPLADITLDWMLDGVVKAGGIVCDEDLPSQPAPSERDALAEGARSFRFRRVPEDALVHASLDVYLRANPDYWRRLPRHIMWSDLDWAARGERLPATDPAPATGPAPALEPDPTPALNTEPDSGTLAVVAS